VGSDVLSRQRAHLRTRGQGDGLSDEQWRGANPSSRTFPEKDMWYARSPRSPLRYAETRLRSGRLPPSERTTLDSLHVMDEIRSQTGVRFPADDAL